ncbi:MAG: hypothetical protein ACRC8S_21500 [Fimbriiglobus sp.]
MALNDGNIITTPNLRPILGVIRPLHSGVPYRGDQTMYNQVLATAVTAMEIGDEPLAALMLLHKSQEKSKVSPGMATLSDADIEKLTAPYGSVVIDALRALRTEPDDKAMKAAGKNETEVWKAMADWAVSLPPLAQKVLLIEKAVNFNGSAQRLALFADMPELINVQKNGKPDKTSQPDWHRDYVSTRMIQVEAIAAASPDLYEAAVESANATVVQYNRVQSRLGIEGSEVPYFVAKRRLGQASDEDRVRNDEHKAHQNVPRFDSDVDHDPVDFSGLPGSNPEGVSADQVQQKKSTGRSA